MKKKLLAILLTVCMVLSMAPAALAADSVFTDVDADDWFAEEVKYVYDNGLMYGVGDNTFDPSGTVTRAMVWTTLARLDGVNTTGSDPWWLAGQKWAMENEISDGTMATENITREQLVTMIWRYAKYIDMDVSEGEDTNILSYTDALDVNEWAISAMQWACAVGIINGIDGALQPQGDASRAMLAAILYRFVEEVMPGEEEPEPSTPVVPSYPSYPVIPPHSHSYTYDSNEDGTHEKVCSCGTTTEDCTIGDDGVCEYCDYIEYYVLDGNEADYTQNTAFQRAIKDLPDGATVTLRNGNFRVAFLSEYRVPANLTVICEDTATVTEFGLEVAVEGLTLKDLNIGGNGILYGVASEAVTVEGLTIDGCTAKAIHLGNAAGCALVDVTVQNCVLTDSGTGFNGITLNNVNGATVKGNRITNAGDIGIALLGTVAGEVTVEGNPINGTGDRVIRFGTISANADVTVSGNTVTSEGDNGQLVKYTSIEDSANIILTGNTWNGYDDEMLGYNNGVWSLPIVVTPETTDIASVIKNAPAGSTIIFAAGNYEKIVLDKIDGLWHNKNNNEGTLYQNTLQYAGPGGDEYDPEKYPEIYNEEYADFHKPLADDLTIVAEAGATVTIAGLDIYSDSGLKGTGYAIDETQATKDILCVAKNLTISGITFTDDVALKGAFIDGWTITDCTFSNGACVDTDENSNTKKSAAADVTITGCIFTGSDSDALTQETRIILGSVEGATISGNKIYAAEYNAIQIGTAAGKIDIINNPAIEGIGDRVFKIATIADGADVTISGNTVTDDGRNGEVVKVDTITGNITITNNTWNGYTDDALTKNNGVWSLPSE